MNRTMRKLALASSITLALAGFGASFSAAAKHPEEQHQNVSQEVSDARREAQIWTSYAVNPHLKAHELKVEVKGDRATLSGKVENGVAKDLAEQIALNVEGIRHVDNRIEVDANYEPPKRVASERSFADKLDDATITASVKSKLLWNSHTDGLDIHVETTAGKVALTGTVGSPAEKDLAGRIARNTNGVVALDNNLNVGAKAPVAERGKTERKPEARTTAARADNANESENPVSDSWITTKVKSTLLFTSNVDGFDITVTTNNGVVKLAGDVDSPGERDRAVELAQNVRGVKKVDPSGIKVR
jgi:osmotically-inducible protein OsmY